MSGQGLQILGLFYCVKVGLCESCRFNDVWVAFRGVAPALTQANNGFAALKENVVPQQEWK